MTIARAISGTVHTRLVTTTSIIAKLAVCAILVAGITGAHATSDDAFEASGVAHRSGVHAAQQVSGAKPRPAQKLSRSKLSKLEREWKRQRSGHQRAALGRLVACHELGRCQGLVPHPTPGSARIHSAAAGPVADDPDEISPSPNGGGEHRGSAFGGFTSANP